MADFFERRDIQAANAFTAVEAIFNLGFESTQQAVRNASDIAMEVSFDGVNVHARLEASGAAQAISWDDHHRQKVYVRRAEAGAGAKVVEVLASTT